MNLDFGQFLAYLGRPAGHGLMHSRVAWSVQTNVVNKMLEFQNVPLESRAMHVLRCTRHKRVPVFCFRVIASDERRGDPLHPLAAGAIDPISLSLPLSVPLVLLYDGNRFKVLLFSSPWE